MSVARILLLFLALGIHPLSEGADVRAMGEARVVVNGDVPSPADVRNALHKGKIQALENYLSQDQVRLDLYDRCLYDTIDEDIERFVTGYTENRRQYDAGSAQLKVIITVGINESRLASKLRRCKGRGQKSRIAFVFVTRQQQGEGVYVVPSANNEVENTLQTVFLDNAYIVTSSNQLESRSGHAYRKDRLERDYANDGDVAWESAQTAVEAAGNDFFAHGTFEIGVPSTDAVSGLQRVAVVVSAQLVDMTRNGRVLAVTSDVQVAALGATREEAIVRARIDAARKIAEKMVAQLNAQGVH